MVKSPLRNLLLLIKSIFLLITFFFSLGASQGLLAQQCQPAGPIDGWGWDGSNSCQLDEGQATNDAAENSSCQPAGPIDGWGWNGSSSCQLDEGQGGTTTPTNNSNCQPAGPIDGWGWNGSSSCQLDEGQNSGGGDPTGNYSPSQITDFILMAGQSNASGQNSIADENNNQDQSSERVFVWVPNPIGDGSTGSWQQADLCTQRWYVDDYSTTQFWPANDNSNKPCQNHPGFQIAKQIAQDSSRVVGLIVSSLPGQGISQWASGANGRVEIDNVAQGAMDALASSIPRNRRYVKYIAWAQGENDRVDGENRNQNNYASQFINLLNHFEGKNWFRTSDNGGGTAGKLVPQYLNDKVPACRGPSSQPNGQLNTRSSNNVNATFDYYLNPSRGRIPAIVQVSDLCTAGIDSNRGGNPNNPNCDAGYDDCTHYNSNSLRVVGQRHRTAFEQLY